MAVARIGNMAGNKRISLQREHDTNKIKKREEKRNITFSRFHQFSRDLLLGIENYPRVLNLFFNVLYPFLFIRSSARTSIRIVYPFTRLAYSPDEKVSSILVYSHC